MNKFKVGNSVQWVVDVDKVYSTGTKTVVGTVGIVLEPQEWYRAPSADAERYLTPEGFYDVEFPYPAGGAGKTLMVGQIPESDLVRVDVEWRHPLLALFSRIYANLLMIGRSKSRWIAS